MVSGNRKFQFNETNWYHVPPDVLIEKDTTLVMWYSCQKMHNLNLIMRKQSVRLGKEAYRYPQNRSMCPIHFPASSSQNMPDSEQIHGSYICSDCVPILRVQFTYLFPVLFGVSPPIFFLPNLWPPRWPSAHWPSPVNLCWAEPWNIFIFRQHWHVLPNQRFSFPDVLQGHHWAGL